MKVNLTYVFDTKDGFRYERETPSEILEIARENYKALKELATGEGDYCDWYIDESKPLFPSGIITAEIDGFHRQYNLTTIVEPITEEETPAEEDDDGQSESCHFSGRTFLRCGICSHAVP